MGHDSSTRPSRFLDAPYRRSDQRSGAAGGSEVRGRPSQCAQFDVVGPLLGPALDRELYQHPVADLQVARGLRSLGVADAKANAQAAPLVSRAQASLPTRSATRRPHGRQRRGVYQGSTLAPGEILDGVDAVVGRADRTRALETTVLEGLSVAGSRWDRDRPAALEAAAPALRCGDQRPSRLPNSGAPRDAAISPGPPAVLLCGVAPLDE